MNRMDAKKMIGNCGIIPVVVIEDEKKAVKTANALHSGGIDVMEVTLRTKSAISSIKNISVGYPDMCVGAGTVITLDQCKEAVDAGAKFIVSPGLDKDVAGWCVDNQICIFPGAVTPTEIMKALSIGIDVLKFFPANVYGGLSAMKALSGPFPDVKFIPTGGISAVSIKEYITEDFVYAVAGSWLCNRRDIEAENFEEITRLTALCLTYA